MKTSIKAFRFNLPRAGGFTAYKFRYEIDGAKLVFGTLPSCDHRTHRAFRSAAQKSKLDLVVVLMPICCDPRYVTVRRETAEKLGLDIIGEIDWRLK